MTIRLKPLLINLFIPLAVGGLSALFTMNSMENFERLNQPPLSPPGWLFPVVWTILYTLMGIAAYLVVTSNATQKDKRTALTIYGVQLFFNFLWSIIFFNREDFLFAFIWLVALWALIIANIILFYRISKPAGIMLIPYLLWVTFAAYLNFAIYLLN
ncbi:MAG: tryptophan-rich sensory protein [Clostridia bacterium]|nr:tryptophan-rich sensory protein [Clostridia bacterium]